MKVLMKMVKRMEEENLLGLMGRNMKGILKTII